MRIVRVDGSRIYAELTPEEALVLAQALRGEVASDMALDVYCTAVAGILECAAALVASLLDHEMGDEAWDILQTLRAHWPGLYGSASDE